MIRTASGRQGASVCRPALDDQRPAKPIGSRTLAQRTLGCSRRLAIVILIICVGYGTASAQSGPPGFQIAPIIFSTPPSPGGFPFYPSAEAASPQLESSFTNFEDIQAFPGTSVTVTFAAIQPCTMPFDFGFGADDVFIGKTINGVAEVWCSQATTVVAVPAGSQYLGTPGPVTLTFSDSVEVAIAHPECGAGQIFGFPNFPGEAFCSGSLSTSLVDPVTAGQVGTSGINPDANALASISSTVVGIAADGAAEIVVRIPAPSAGTQFQLSLVDEDGSAVGPANQGYLATLLPTDPGATTVGGNPVTVTSVALSNGGAMAFALYFAPKDFVRDGNSTDPSMVTRKAFVDVSMGGTVQTEQEIGIVRPPVAFIHGIWGSGDDGDQILSSLMSQGVGLTTYALGYDGSVTIASSTPSYGSNLAVSGSNLGFSFAASTVLPELHAAIADYRTNNALGQPIAVAQADIVSHSMGGDVARTLPLMNGFAGPENYGLGPLHKLITLGTPHLGSPLALKLLNGSNDCVRGLLAFKKRYAFTSVTAASGSSYSGGVGDLSADVFGTSLSDSLTAIQHGSVMIPTALIAAKMSQAQRAAVDTDSHAKEIRLLCGQLASNPLAEELTSSGWPTVLSSESDAIVPLNSQLAGSTENTIFPLGSEVHSPGTEELGFGGPSELDDTGVIAPEVLQLLNTPVDQSAFKPLP